MKILMMQVEKRQEDEDFAFDDLRIWHEECHGGRIMQEKFTWRPSRVETDDMPYDPVGTPGGFFSAPRRTANEYGPFPSWILRCRRCEASAAIFESEVLDIVKTALDGQQRTTETSKLRVSQRS